MPRPSSRLVRGLAGLALLLALLLGALPAARAQDARYFPETGHTLRGMFRAFWEQNGALYTFGFPITEEFSTPGGRTIQWFERARFELVNGRVELGMLGLEFTEGRAFPKVPPIENTADKRYFPETQHIVQYGFKTIWETRGQLPIFGFPISEEIDEVLEDGQWHTVQYFERARFEYWPERAPGDRVLISLLGRRMAPADRTAPVPPPGQPQPQPTAPPAAPAPPPLPPSVNARVTPESGPPGTSFVFDGYGFQPGENVGVWLTAPDQSTFGASFQAVADAEGSIAYQQIGIETDASFPQGIWSFVGQGVSSGRQAVGYFRITAPAQAPPPAAGDPARLGQVVHDQLPRQGNAFILPVAAPPGTPFVLLAAGYQPGEGIAGWVTGPTGQSAPIDPSLITLDAEGVAQLVVDTAGLAEGVYTAVAYGQSSKVTNAAAFKLTRDFVAGPGTPRPANVGGEVSPQEGPPGTRFDLRGGGLAANEPAEVWITEPGGSYLLYPERIPADGNGRLGINPPLFLQPDASARAGVYGVHFRGVNSRARVDLYMTVTGSARGDGGPGALLRAVEQLVAEGSLPPPSLWRR